MDIFNILVPALAILLITGIALGSYLTFGGILMVVVGIGAQFVGFWVLLFAQKSVRVKWKELEKLLEYPKEFQDQPYLQTGHNQWRLFWGWFVVSIGLITQMVGLFLPETGLFFQNSS